MRLLLPALSLVGACGGAPAPVITRAELDNSVRLHVAGGVGASVGIGTLALDFEDGTSDRVNVLLFGGTAGAALDASLGFPSGPLLVPAGAREADLYGRYDGTWWGAALALGWRGEDLTNAAGAQLHASGWTIGVTAAKAPEALYVVRLMSADDS